MGQRFDVKAAAGVKLKKIEDVARKAGIASKFLTKYGKYMAMVMPVSKHLLLTLVVMHKPSMIG